MPVLIFQGATHWLVHLDTLHWMTVSTYLVIFDVYGCRFQELACLVFVMGNSVAIPQ